MLNTQFGVTVYFQMKLESLWITVYMDLVYVTFVSYAVNPGMYMSLVMYVFALC